MILFNFQTPEIRAGIDNQLSKEFIKFLCQIRILTQVDVCNYASIHLAQNCNCTFISQAAVSQIQKIDVFCLPKRITQRLGIICAYHLIMDVNLIYVRFSLKHSKWFWSERGLVYLVNVFD